MGINLGGFPSTMCGVPLIPFDPIRDARCPTNTRSKRCPQGIETEGHPSCYCGDSAGNKLRVSDTEDGKDNSTYSWTYDELSRVRTESIVVGGSGEKSWEYSGLTTKSTNLNGWITTHIAGLNGRSFTEQVSLKSNNSTATPPILRQLDFSYDSLGRLVLTPRTQ